MLKHFTYYSKSERKNKNAGAGICMYLCYYACESVRENKMLLALLLSKSKIMLILQSETEVKIILTRYKKIFKGDDHLILCVLKFNGMTDAFSLQF